MNYTFVIFLDNIKCLKDKIENLSIFSKKEIIIIGDSNSQKQILKNYLDVKYIINDSKNTSDCYNDALKISQGNYINFSYASDFVSKETLKIIDSICREKTNIICIKSKSFEKKRKESKPIFYTTVSLHNCSKYELYLSSYFFSKNIYKSIKFINNIYNFQVNYIIDAIVKNFGLTMVTNRYCYYQKIPNFIKETELANEEDWYTNDIKNYIIPLLKKYSLHYIKNIALMLLITKAKANLNSIVKSPLDVKETKEFLKYYRVALEHIDDEIILSQSSLNNEHQRILLFIKYNLYNENILLTKEGCITKNNIILDNPSKYKIVISAINKVKEKLVFDVEYNAKYLIENGGKIEVVLNGEKVKIKENEVYSSTKIWKLNLNTKYTFSFDINKDSITNNSKIDFYYSYKSERHKLDILFNNNAPQSRLTKQFPHSYWKYDENYVLTYKNQTLIFKKMYLPQRIRQELYLYKDFIFKSQKRKLGIQALILRLIYRLTKPYYKNKRIWVTFDKLYKGGDNGEYFYQFMQKNSKIRCYYIINETAYDYTRLKKQKYILRFKSLKEYLTVLNAECIFGTHAKVYNMCSFTKGKEKYFRDLFNQEIFCLQHGLTIQDIEHIQNRLYDNTKLYFCASFKEIENIMKPVYDYYRFDYIKKTGLARYDGLKNNNQKTILITPTWRANMANTKTIIGETRPYYEDFKNTIYFKIYNNLINNKKLIETAKKYGYKIIYLIHPTLSSQINDFEKNSYVKVFTVTEDQSYEKLLTTSSLMITDYSGVQFDFAYMNKPIIYYHPEELPAHYGDGGINYQKEGFGPIFSNQEELIDEICEYIKNDCQMNEIYSERTKDFFIYNDHNNCQRIYEEAYKYMEGLKEKKK